MRTKRPAIRFYAALLALFFLIGALVLPCYADSTDNNRFNVMFVLDASGSMNDTDPSNLRFEAISQFTNLLAEHGNFLGGIVFSTKILSEQPPIRIDAQHDKDQVVQQMTSVAASGWTNTGDALMAAVNALLEKGDPNLPSVIVFLSDGNTTLGNDKDTEASLNTKADAIQKARENGIVVYSVCLNADHSADVSEMEQISKATGGEFREVGTPEDLGDVFNTFYNLIYGTSTITLVDDTFPESGIVEKTFEVPGIGVEEVNIIIYGKTSNLALFKPDGAESSAAVTSLNSLTMIKITDVVPGTWRIVTTGVPGDKIKVNMVYNTNLGVRVFTQPTGNDFTTDSGLRIFATLHAGDVSASSAEQYNGYSVTLHVFDAYEDELYSIPMNVVGDHFEAEPQLAEGAYKFMVSVTGSYANKDSEILGPVNILPKDSSNIPEEVHINRPPEAVENPVQKTVYIWPFKDNTVEIDMTELAVDDEDSNLHYRIMSSSFMEGTDYSVNGNIVSIEHFSLSKGAFTIKATDSGGLSCDIEVIITSHNVGIMALIGIGAAALIGLAIFGVMLYILLNKRFMGPIYVTQYDENGNFYEEVKREKGRGRIKLSSFNLKQTSFNTSKCYFQASGKNYVTFVGDKKVYGNGVMDKKIKIDGSGFEVEISPDQNSCNGIRVKFISRLNNTNYSF